MDPISAMRMAAAGRITPFNPPVLDQAPKIGADDLKQLGNLGSASGLKDLGGLGNLGPGQELKSLGSIGPATGEILPQTGVGAGRPFSEFLGEMVRDVNAKQAEAGRTVDGLLSGQNVPLHQAVIAVEEANVSFQLMVEVRNKLLDSYQELMRMQI